MSINISKLKRDDLLNKINQIHTYIANAPQDENTGKLLTYLSELEKDINGKKYGLVFEEHREKIDEVLNASDIYVQFQDKILGFETPPVIESGSTLVPMRFLFEQMGADVEWNGETQTVTATLDNTEITFSINNINAEVNNILTTMDVPARLVNGKTMVPLRFLSENMGYTVEWDADSRTAIIQE